MMRMMSLLRTPVGNASRTGYLSVVLISIFNASCCCKMLGPFAQFCFKFETIIMLKCCISYT